MAYQATHLATCKCGEVGDVVSRIGESSKEYLIDIQHEGGKICRNRIFWNIAERRFDGELVDGNYEIG